ncbi:MAG: hypothetical protein ACREMU_06600, partial [Gemmatimonadaceae bacterium]
MHSRRIVALLASLVVVAGCSKKESSSNQQASDLAKKLGIPFDTSGSSGSEKTGDPCSLLDSSEVAAAIGP